jgi:hypothetical protein
MHITVEAEAAAAAEAAEELAANPPPVLLDEPDNGDMPCLC